MNIFDRIIHSRQDHTEPFLISQHEVISPQLIRAYQDRLSGLLQFLKGKSVCIHLQEQVSIAKWLILLDGLASRLFLVPSDISPTNAQELLADFHIDYEISESNINTFKSSEASISNDVVRNQKTEWILTTSGTTSTPKLVSHDLSSLSTTTKIQNQAYDNRWGLLYSPARFAGLQVLLQALLSDSVFVISELGLLNEQLIFFSKERVNCISATPTMWRKILMSPASKHLDLKVITLGGEIVDQLILDALTKQYPNAIIRHIYASTETGTGFSVSDGKSGFPMSYLESGVRGAELRISSENTLLLRSTAASTGYLGGTHFPIDKDGFVDTGDLIHVDGDRCYFLGRQNGAINVGGQKVQPEFVESILMQMDEVRLARVKPIRSTFMGNLVKADVQLTTPGVSNSIEKRLRQFCEQHLEAYMVPAIFEFVEDIQTSTNGKIKRT